MADWLLFFLLVLACYRLSQLVAIDEGPGSVFLDFRARLGAYDRRADGEAKTSLGRGIACPHCVGIWVALPLAAIGSGINSSIFIWWLAIAGGQSILWNLVAVE